MTLTMIYCQNDKILMADQDKNLLSAISVMTKRGKYPKNFIKELRDKRGWTTREVAKRAGPGWHNQTVSALELSKQELTWSKILTLANVFECHPLEITEGPALLPLPKNEIQKKVLEAMNQMSDKEQEMYGTGFLSGLNMPKREDVKSEEPEPVNERKSS